jgi:hypothetical protein
MSKEFKPQYSLSVLSTLMAKLGFCLKFFDRNETTPNCCSYCSGPSTTWWVEHWDQDTMICSAGKSQFKYRVYQGFSSTWLGYLKTLLNSSNPHSLYIYTVWKGLWPLLIIITMRANTGTHAYIRREHDIFPCVYVLACPFLPGSNCILIFLLNFFEISTFEDFSQPTIKHANKILVSIFLTMKATIIDTHGVWRDNSEIWLKPDIIPLWANLPCPNLWNGLYYRVSQPVFFINVGNWLECPQIII